MVSSLVKPRLYFAYGSNLSLEQMKSRCPTSTYHSFGFLRDYQWIIGERGYANVVKVPVKAADRHMVYGMLYTLESKDEERIDIAEGVPYSYIKMELDIELVTKVASKEGGKNEEDGLRNVEAKGEIVKALVYVDVTRMEEGSCVEEYVARINRGVKDAKTKGMEDSYVRKYIRPFVREEKVPDEVEDPFYP